MNENDIGIIKKVSENTKFLFALAYKNLIFQNKLINNSKSKLDITDKELCEMNEMVELLRKRKTYRGQSIEHSYIAGPGHAEANMKIRERKYIAIQSAIQIAKNRGFAFEDFKNIMVKYAHTDKLQKIPIIFLKSIHEEILTWSN